MFPARAPSLCDEHVFERLIGEGERIIPLSLPLARAAPAPLPVCVLAVNGEAARRLDRVRRRARDSV